MYNRAILVGRLTADPELKQTPSGTFVTSFALAVSRPFVDKTTGDRQTDFINIVAWRQQAEFVCKYFKKGNMMGLEGAIQQRNYNDKDGNKRTAFEIVMDRSFFVESKGSSNNNSNVPMENNYSAPRSNGNNNNFSNAPSNQSFPVPQFDGFQEVDIDDDLPF